jgi:soluble lytic murein transglycosylase
LAPPVRPGLSRGLAIVLLGLLAGCSINTPWFEMRVGAPTVEAAAITSVTLIPTPTSAWTATPLAPPTATPAPTPTPTPTPNPEALIANAESSARAGAGPVAIELYERAAPLLPANSPQQAYARFRLGQLKLSEGDAAGAARDLAVAVANAPGASFGADAQILLGRARSQSGDYSGAIAAWSAALTVTSPISTYLHGWIGDAQIALKAPAQAITPFLRALDDTTTASQAAVRREKLALARQLSGDYDGAAADYDAILAFARIPAYRARILMEKAKVRVAGGNPREGYGLMQQLLTDYPAESAAFNALVTLLDAEQPVDDLQRGIVNYHAANHPSAQQAFVRAINAARPGQSARTDEILYWAGLNYIALESLVDAARNLDPLIANPRSARYADALLAEADALADAGAVDEPVRLYRLRANALPGTPSASAALASAGRVLERAGRMSEAAVAYASAVAGAPADEAERLRGEAAVARLRAGGSEAVLKAAPPITTALSIGAREPFWIAKAAQIAGKLDIANAWWAALTRTAPSSYEAVRSAELRDGRAPMTRVSVEVKPVSDTAGFGAALAWLSGWTGVTVTASISPATGLVSWLDVPRWTANRAFVRGETLQRLGLGAEAGAEFDAALSDLGADPVALFQAAIRWRELGGYRHSIQAATRLALRAPGGLLAAPDFVARLAYPTYFSALIEPAAAEFKLDPLLIYALIRQESLFESNALSSAAARGLMQVIPATGREIAGQLNWPPNYSTQDLNKPAVSVRFGVYYLSRQVKGFDGDLVAALAAYNAGPGRALRWREAGGGDPDFFVEAMTLSEPVLYVRNISVNFAAYTRLYAK